MTDATKGPTQGSQAQNFHTANKWTFFGQLVVLGGIVFTSCTQSRQLQANNVKQSGKLDNIEVLVDGRLTKTLLKLDSLMLRTDSLSQQLRDAGHVPRADVK